MSRYLLDSDVIIGFLKGQKETIGLIADLEKTAGIPSTSPVCITEVQAGVKPGEKDLVNEVSEATNLTKKEVRPIVNTLFETMRENRIELRGFGVFEVIRAA